MLSCKLFAKQSIRVSFVSLQSAFHRNISSFALAKEILGLDPHAKPSAKELRHAYFQAAKAVHPDTQGHNHADAAAMAAAFNRVTEAYELLQNTEVGMGADLGISIDEEEEFRMACREHLGLSAEIVEESKSNPMFRQWLQGKTDAAFSWRTFLAQYGGLAPKLRPKPMLAANPNRPMSERRRRRTR